MPTVSVQELLSGTYYGRRQSVGNMEVIPILGEDDENYSPPELRVSTNNYGSVQARNVTDRPTIVPPGSGWIVNARVQDHAIGSGALVPAKATAALKAYCIQETQSGLIDADQEKTFIVLPLPLRVRALASRNRASYNELWSPISRYRSKASGMRGCGNLVEYLEEFSTDLDRFVAHFECVPKQIGAIVLINHKVVGVEIAPSTAFWSVLWEPLIRVCYGSYALVLQDKASIKKRLSIRKAKTVWEVISAFSDVQTQWALETKTLVKGLCAGKLQAAGQQDHGLYTGASSVFAGQFLRDENASRTPYVSLVSNVEV